MTNTPMTRSEWERAVSRAIEDLRNSIILGHEFTRQVARQRLVSLGNLKREVGVRDV